MVDRDKILPLIMVLSLFKQRGCGRPAALLLLAFALSGAAQAAPKSVLIFHSFGPNATPYHAMAAAFQTALARGLGEPVDFYEASLDADRFSGPEMELALVEFLQKRFTEKRLDLIATIGSPAARFVAQYRDRAFPGTPVLYVQWDPRLVNPQDLRNNATVIRQSMGYPGIIEDILQMAPDTAHVFVVLGTSPLERFWADVGRRETKAFGNRVEFSWLNDLSLDQIEKRVSVLPPHSFVLFVLMIRDAAGITYDGYEPLQRLHRVANVPLYGYFQSQMGRGIVGGRLVQDETVGIKAAHTAVRILRGESASNIPEEVLGTPDPVYDWRELTRWGISEALLPPGSVIRFRQPTVWELYRWRIVGLLSFVLAQTLLIVGLLRNLARRRRAERSLRQSEERHRRLFEAESDALFLTDGETGRFLDANPAAERMYGYSRNELLNLQARDISAEPEMTGLALAEGQTHVSLRLHRRKDGSVFPVDISAGRLDDSGRTSYVVAIRDVTDRLRAEELLRQSERKYRWLYESMMDAFVSVDMSGLIREFNPAYRQLLGYTEEELRRLTYMEVTPERWHEFEAQIISDQVLHLGYSSVYEKEYRDKSGRVFPVELRTFLLRDEASEPCGMWAIVRDISERKRAEAALRASEERFRQVAETVSDFIWEVDADGLYRYTSPSVERILGYTPDELIGKLHFYDLFAPDTRETLKAAALRVVEARQPFRTFRNTNISKNGKTVHLETSGIPLLGEDGRLLGYRGADTDVTQRQEAEMEVRLLREKLAHFSRIATVGELTTSIAHELNQPLAAILSNAQAGLLLLQDGDPDPKELREIYEDIIADDQRAGEVIRHLRSLLGRHEIERRKLRVNSVIGDVLSIVRSDSLLRHVSVVLDLDSRLPEVEGDRVQLQQVLLNLVSNAYDAMAEIPERRRELVLRTRRAAGNIVLVDVVDSGTGIAPDRLQSIFEPFITTKKTGLGMGLSLCQSIVSAHDGRIWAENNPKGGATFHVALPAIEEPL